MRHNRTGSVLGSFPSSLPLHVVTLDSHGKIAARPAGLHLLSLKDVKQPPYGGVDCFRVAEGDLIYVYPPEVPVDVFPR